MNIMDSSSDGGESSPDGNVISDSDHDHDEVEDDKSDYEPPEKKSNDDWSKSYSHKAMKMMKNMGYQDYKGLGKRGQGRLEPIEASKQDGRRGLGLKLDDLSKAATQWDPLEEPDPFETEEMNWLINDSDDFDNITMDDLSEYVVRGPVKLDISDETKFCDARVLEKVLATKSGFDKMDKNEMRRATMRSNPYETIRGSIFLNRAAVKMANMNYLCDFMFTNPIDKNNQPLVRDNDLLYFADLCAGPGGFTEYILSKRGWEAKGFGFTLRNENDFKLDDFFAGSPETFDPYYGVKEDGDIFDPENQESFFEYVLKQTNTGVHFVMADGGFSVEGQENIQEILSKQLYLCQCLVALSILRENGHFVCKLFDLFTPFSVGLVYLMYKCFEEICICKPKTSRPANSERYLICKWKKSNADTIRRHLFNINRELHENPKSGETITELVSCSQLFEDNDFIEYITKSNNDLGTNQIIGLFKIAAFAENTKLKETKQDEVRKFCLNQWKLPDKMRTRQAPELPSTETLLNELLREWQSDKEFFKSKATELSPEHLNRNIKSVLDWFFVPIGREENETNITTFFLCKGRGIVLQWTRGKWEPVSCNKLQLPPKTLVYGEIVTEYIGEAKCQNKINALHIIDGIALGGKDIRRLPLEKRLQMCSKFAHALNKPYKNVKSYDGNQPPVAPIRAKKLIPFQDIEDFFSKMSLRSLKSGPPRLGHKIRTDDDQERFFVPGGLLFLRFTHPDFTTHISKSQHKQYHYHVKTQKSYFEDQIVESLQLYASTRCSFVTRLLWKWSLVSQVDNADPGIKREDKCLYRYDIQKFLHPN